MMTPDVPERWVGMADKKVRSISMLRPMPEDLARAALEPVLADLRRQVEALEALPTYADEDTTRTVLTIERDAVLALLDTGGSDGD